MIRVALTVVLAAALVAASLPAINDARAARAVRVVESDVAVLRAAGTELVRESDPVSRDLSGARAVVTVRLPVPSFAHAGVAYLAVGGHPNRTVRADGPASDVVVYRVGDRPPRVLGVPVDLRAVRDGVRRDGTPLVLRRDARLLLGYVRVSGDDVVTVARAGVRNFKSENTTSPPHARA